jgi:DNA-binding helix-hairpin-helix protein with protein kinase domain
MRLYDGAGRTVALGREIARGGEGAILEVTDDPGLVAKVYHTAVDKDKVVKLAAMARLASSELLHVAAWPTSTLHELPGREIVGILMPKVAGREIHQLYSPAQRKLYFPKADWSFLSHVAMNCAAAFQTVHEHGQIIGDVNQSGVMVSDRGTTQLIDCDSFQIRSGGRLFYCTVGVPQYTPPELQGRAFRGIERTREHDAFGLALLIFHLLFMGRHPFAGRFNGSGDMPIERAISEGRFAFGSHAPGRGMAQPPFSLSLTALPPAIASLFERAFARPVPGIPRPAAAEWYAALQTLKSELTVCANDRGHRYVKTLRVCPWCEIMEAGGPNFFISIQVTVSGETFVLTPFDVTGFHNRIQAHKRPSPIRPTYPALTKPLIPRPLPEEVREERFQLRLVEAMAVVGIGTGIAGLFVKDLMSYIGFAVALTFAIWRLVLRVRSKLAREMHGRRDEVRRLRAMAQQEQEQWDRVARESISGFEKTKDEAIALLNRAREIQPAFERERFEIEFHRREEQLEQFLDTIFIRDHRIARMGPGRRATLLSWNIETAADVTRQKLEQIPGFGDKMIESLLAWRRQVEGRFSAKDLKAIPSEKMRALVIKYRQLQQHYGGMLDKADRELHGISNGSAAELSRIEQRIVELVPLIRQAEADLRAK